MAFEIVMPKWGLSMQEGLIGRWLKQEGDFVQEGEELVEIETEKITNVVEAPASGILARIIHPAGSTIPVTHIIALMTAPGEPIPDLPMSAAPVSAAAQPAAAASAPAAPIVPPSAEGPIRALPAARQLAKEHNLDLAAIQGSGPHGTITKADVERALAARPAPSGPIRILPAARHLAKEHNLDPATIQGSGPNGTITKADVERALAARTAATTPRPLQKVAFYSEGHRLDGLLYSPANLAPGEKRPGVVLCVGYTYLKTMVAPDLAKALNQAGYVALLFDYRGFGESEGTRWRLIPQEQVSDVRAALTFLADQAQVNPEQLAVVGISLGGAHAITVGALDSRVNAVVAIEPPGHGERWLRTLRRHTEWLDFQARLAQDRVRRVRTGQSERVDPLEIVLPDPGSRTFLENVACEFPQMKCDLPLETADALIDYKPEAVVGQIAPRPLLLIHGDHDRLVPVDESRSLFAHAGEPRRLAVVPGMDHFDWVMPNSSGFRHVANLMVEFLQEFLPVK